MCMLGEAGRRAEQGEETMSRYHFSAFANATESLPFQNGTRARW